MNYVNFCDILLKTTEYKKLGLPGKKEVKALVGRKVLKEANFTAIQEGDLDSCLKSMLQRGEGMYISVGEFTTYSDGDDELPDLELFVDALKLLENAEKVELRISRNLPLIGEKEVDEATEDIFMNGQFLLLEGHLSLGAEEWLQKMTFAVKTLPGLVAIAKEENELPEDNLMYAMYAADLGLPLENIAIITKKDD